MVKKSTAAPAAVYGNEIRNVEFSFNDRRETTVCFVKNGWEGPKSRMIREPENLIASASCDRSSEGRYQRHETH